MMVGVTGLAAVLFDMDGTLVDSEKIWDVALNDLAQHYGGVLSEAGRAAMVGTSSAETMELLRDDLGRPDLDLIQGAEWLDARAAELFHVGLPWLPGARELLHEVRAAGLGSALVTNTKRVLAEVVLETLGRDNFDVVVCGDEVPRPKPDPAPYQLAAQALGVPPARCVAIEDSPTGVASARAAGCAVLAVPNAVVFTPDAALVAESLLEVRLDLLRTLITAPVD